MIGGVILANLRGNMCNKNPVTFAPMTSERYFTREQFIEQFNAEVAYAAEVWQKLRESGFQEYALAVFDFNFVSDTAEKLESLKQLLTSTYDFVTGDIVQKPEGWAFRGVSNEFPIDAGNLLCWAIDLLVKGFELDCRLESYGTFAGKNNDEFPDMATGKLESYFNGALSAFQQQNYAAAAINFTTAIRIFDTNPNAWYSRAAVKDSLYLVMEARADYDKAIELAPAFKEAYINRAVNYYESGEFDAAIADFNKVLELDPENAMGFYNRGNTKYSNGDQAGACADWKRALALGAEYAQERLDEYCK